MDVELDPELDFGLDRAQRLVRLQDLADEIERRRDELVQAILACAKKTVQVAAGEVQLAIARLRAFDQVLPLLRGRRPVGTVAVVFPSNASLSNPVATIGNAFLAGNRVVARFPSAARTWAELLEPIFLRHLPGVRFDHGSGQEFLHRVLADPAVAVAIVFGDDAWALPYEEVVRRQRKKLIFEGPGNDPFLVLPGADLAAAAADAVRGGYYNAGQACTSPERFYVHRELFAEFVDRVLAATRRQVVGEPERPEVTVGPIVGRHIAGRIAEHLDDARQLGAQLLAGGGVTPGRLGDGTPVTWVEPTVLAGVDGRMKVMQEETFGPVIAIQEVASTAEALHLAADSSYGLAANLYGGDDGVAAVLAESHGQVFRDEIWLDYFARLLHAPYGGRKRSGWVWAWEGERFVRREGVRTNALEFSRGPAPESVPS